MLSMTKDLHDFLTQNYIPADLPVVVRPYRCRKSRPVMIWRLFAANPDLQKAFLQCWMNGVPKLYHDDPRRNLGDLSASFSLFFSMFEPLRVK